MHSTACLYKACASILAYLQFPTLLNLQTRHAAYLMALCASLDVYKRKVACGKAEADAGLQLALAMMSGLDDMAKAIAARPEFVERD